jgi:hypothetical protein
MIERGFIISTPLCENINIDHFYKGVRVDINGFEIKVDRLPLKLHDFDIILGMDWLGIYGLKWIIFQKQ